MTGRDSVCALNNTGFGAGRVFVLSSLLSFGLALLIMKAVFGSGLCLELYVGWGLAFVNAGTGVVVNILAVGRGREGFITLGIVGNMLRAVGVLVIILAVRLWVAVTFKHFICAFLAGYFVFWIAETMRLSIVSLKDQDRV